LTGTTTGLRAPPRLGIVVPCYDESEVLPETLRRLTAALSAMQASGRIAAGAQLWLVDDGSRDDTWALIAAAATADPRVRGLKLSRNVGHQRALMAGLATAAGDVLVSIDADLQDDPAVIATMIDAYRGGADIVYGVRNDRTTDGWFKLCADCRLLSRAALDALAQYGETNLFLRALVPQLGFTSATVPYARAERFAGTSKYPLRKMIGLALDGVTSFSTRPLRLITMLGFVVSITSFMLGLWALWSAAFSPATVPGWASTTVPIFMICGVQLLSLGIIGEYVGKIYFETKRRPRYIVEMAAGVSIPGSSVTAPLTAGSGS